MASEEITPEAKNQEHLAITGKAKQSSPIINRDINKLILFRIQPEDQATLPNDIKLASYALCRVKMKFLWIISFGNPGSPTLASIRSSKNEVEDSKHESVFLIFKPNRKKGVFWPLRLKPIGCHLKRFRLKIFKPLRRLKIFKNLIERAPI